MKARISKIRLGVDDGAPSVRFYEQGLGWPRRESHQPFFWIDLHEGDDG